MYVHGTNKSTIVSNIILRVRVYVCVTQPIRTPTCADKEERKETVRVIREATDDAWIPLNNSCGDLVGATRGLTTMMRMIIVVIINTHTLIQI